MQLGSNARGEVLTKHTSQQTWKRSQLGDAIIRSCNFVFGGIEALRRRLGRPHVKTISTDDLQQSLRAANSPVVLVDVRAEVEQQVSRICGAITIDEYESNPDRFADQVVVPYCTVGGRSYMYTRRLAEAGVACRNYEDGIIGWCRQGLPLETADHQPTRDVHPYWRIFRVPADYQVRT